MTEGQPIKPGPVEPPKPPSLPASSAKKAPAIHTMRDDLTQARRSVPLPSAAAASIMRQPKVGAKEEVKDTVAHEDTEPIAKGSLLQPKLPAPVIQEVEEFVPVASAKSRNGLIIALLVIFLILAVGAGGLWAWLYFTEESQEVAAPDENVTLSMAEVIPSNALIVARYKIDSPAQATAIQKAWDERSQVNNTMTAAITGDPRLFLSRGVTDFLYVLLPGDPRLYVVLEGSDSVDQFLAEYSNVQVTSIGQWRVLHAFNTSLYEQGLAQESFSQAARTLVVGDDPLTIMATRELLEQAHQYASHVVPTNNYMNIGVSFSEGEDSDIALIGTSVGSLIHPPVSFDVSDILQRVPGDATFVRIGSSFSGQIFRATTPASTQLFSELTEPYAYYERVGDDGVKDVGVIVRIPESQAASLVLPNAGVEETLPELIAAANLGQKPTIGLTFADVIYQQVALRYVNLSTHQLALDYAIDGGFITAATSREGMEVALNVAQDSLESALDTSTWAALQDATAQQSNDRILGVITQPALKRLFPGGNEANSLQFSLSFDPAATPGPVAGAVLLP